MNKSTSAKKATAWEKGARWMYEEVTGKPEEQFQFTPGDNPYRVAKDIDALRRENAQLRVALAAKDRVQTNIYNLIARGDVLLPSDTWHSEQADWRIGIVTQLETQYSGCSDHTVGAAVLNR